MRRTMAGAFLAVAALKGARDARAQACANPCTLLPGEPTVNIVYFGATAVNQAINTAMQNLYGTPNNTCSATIKTYRCLRDLDNNGIPETCVKAYVGDNLGSCEGLAAMDTKGGAFNVCKQDSPPNTLIAANA